MIASDGQPGNIDDTPAPLVPLTPDGAIGHVSAPLSPVRATHVLDTTTIRCCSARAPYSTDQCQLCARETTSSDSFAVAFLARARCKLLLHRAAAWRGAHYPSPRTVSGGTSATVAYSCMGLPRDREAAADARSSRNKWSAASLRARLGRDCPRGSLHNAESCHGPVSGPRARYEMITAWTACVTVHIFALSPDYSNGMIRPMRDGGARSRAARADSIKLFVIIDCSPDCSPTT